MAFRVIFDEWIDANQYWAERFRPNGWPIPQFRVFQEEDHLFDVYLLYAKEEPVFKYENRKDEFNQALLRYAVQRIEKSLQSESLWIDSSSSTIKLDIEDVDLPSIKKLMEEKTCTYQVKEGRDLFCSAGTLDDLVKGSSSARRVPTSSAVCLACNLPDSGYLCSHLSHAAIESRRATGSVVKRFAEAALCDLGKPGADREPSQCRPGGHSCWELIVEPEIEVPQVPSSPLALHEAFGYLDAVWRLAFGRNHALLRLTTMADIAQLSQPCKTRSDFESMMSALAAVLKAMDIPEDLFPGGVSHIQKDHTLERMKNCLKHKLGGEYDVSCDRAIDVLHAVNAVRYSQQHGNQREMSRAFSRLGIAYPSTGWGDTWGSICAKTIEALEVIREKVRNLSIVSEAT